MMNLKKGISLLLMTVYLLATAGAAVVSLTCRCMEQRVHAEHVCLSECQHDMPADGVVRSCCGCELHSTDIELYLYSSAENGERHIRCTVTDLPPAITAECPCPERVPVLREKSAERRSPFVQEASILPVGFRAPPVSA